MESKSPLDLEVGPDIVHWAESLRSYAPIWEDPEEDVIDPLVRFLSLDFLRKKRYVAIPFLNFWAPDTDPSFAAIEKYDLGRFYGTSFRFWFSGDKCLSCSASHKNLYFMTQEFKGLCVVAPRNEEFIMLQTIYDYWILAAAPDLISKILEKPLNCACEQFSEEATTNEDNYEIGKLFGEKIADLYLKHNEDIINRWGFWSE